MNEKLCVYSNEMKENRKNKNIFIICLNMRFYALAFYFSRTSLHLLYILFAVDHAVKLPKPTKRTENVNSSFRLGLFWKVDSQPFRNPFQFSFGHAELCRAFNSASFRYAYPR